LKNKYNILILLLSLCLFSNNVKAQLDANFSAAVTSGCAPVLIQFSNSSTGNPVSYLWDFGNGTQSTIANPSVTYFFSGNYNVTLIVTNTAGVKDTTTKQNYITINPKPVVNFTANDTVGCYPLVVQFTDNSSIASGSNVSWLWDFGDGTSSTLQNPTKTYAQGTHTVVLQVISDKGCSNTLVKPNYIKASNGIVSNYTFTTINTCTLPTAVQFTNSTTGSGTLNYLWNFGDGGTSTLTNPTHNYTTPGNYSVTLTTTSNEGCTNTITQTNAIVIGTTNASFTSANSICLGAPISFANTSPASSSVKWYFGDGNNSVVNNPSHIYNTTGSFTVKLVVDFGGCKDSVQKQITVINKPTANFAISDSIHCKAPFTVNFTNTSINASSYNWNFGDGATASIANPSHTYTANGNYTVILIVTNAGGCSDTIIKTNLIKIQPPTVSFTNLPIQGCAPLTVTPNVVINAIDGIQSYNWNFGNGFTSTASSPSSTYTNQGNYAVSLTITTNTGCVVTIQDSVKVGIKPIINFTATPTTSCAFSPVSFTNAVTPSATYYYWLFGDGNSSYLPNPSTSYLDTGYFSVTLIVGNNGCFDTIRKPNYIYINPPVANFLAPVDCANPFVRNFRDTSIAPLTWLWEFGDGNTATTQHPSYTYTQQGTYNTKLTVTNGSCVHSVNRLIHIIDEQINFSYNDSIICRRNLITFTSTFLKRTNITKFAWDFGDGTIINGDSVVSHQYLSSGNYVVKLTITDLNNCTRTITRIIPVIVYGPTVNFTTTILGACISAPVVYNDLSTTDGTHPITNWQWSFGDGVTQNYTTPPFSHAYNTNGNFAVSLKITDSFGCTDSISINNAIVVSKPTANFNTLDTLTCPGANVVFSNTSVGNSLTHNWSFSNGSTSVLSSPTQQFINPGSYSAQLIVTDNNGCKDTLQKPSYIRVVNPIANFSVSDSFSTCPPLFVQFNNLSQDYESLIWDFGDGSSASIANPTHFYTSPGIFIAKLTITSVAGCTKVFTKNIKILGPSGSLTYNPLQGCNPLVVTLTVNAQNTASFVYDFNNGQTISSNNPQTIYIYTQPGVYLPRVILKDTNGCSIPIIGLDSVKVYGITSSVQANTHVVCDSGIVQFSLQAQSNNPIINYAWNFGDGGVGTGSLPNHNYTTSGTYNVDCIITTALGCKDTTYLQIPVVVTKTPIIDFTPLYTSACAPALVNFQPIIVQNDNSTLQWNWNLGNGNTSNIMQPPAQLYNTAGSYNITAIATHNLGCKDTVTKVFIANPIPNTNAGLSTQICRDGTALLTASGATSYAWSPAAGLSCATCGVTNATPDTTRIYYVTGTNNFGCSTTDSVAIKVVQRFNMSNSPSVGFCNETYTILNATGAKSYIWSPAAGLSSTTDSTVVAKPTATTTYRVIGFDSENCFTDTANIVVTLFPKPTVNAGADITIVGGLSATLNPTTSANIVAYNWSNGSTLSCTNCKTPVATPPQTTTYKLEVTSTEGCKNSDEVTVFVTCDKGNLFVPNTFSPNNDGMNDVLYPRGNGIHKVKALRIYNRWGELVFEQNNFDVNDVTKGWNGTHKGQKLPADVFVYTIEVQCMNKIPMQFKGNITLIQ
jgi:gliding motility-associated-like protein